MANMAEELNSLVLLNLNLKTILSSLIGTLKSMFEGSYISESKKINALHCSAIDCL